MSSQTAGESIRNVAVEITTACALGCAHCERTELLRQGRFDAFSDMSPRVFQRLLAFLAGSSCTVNLSGGLGDPLLRADIAQLVAQVRAAGHQPYLYASVHYLLHSGRLARLFHAGLERVLISVDTWHLDAISRQRERDVSRAIELGSQRLREAASSAHVRANVVLDVDSWRPQLDRIVPALVSGHFDAIEVKWRYPLASRAVAGARRAVFEALEGLAPSLYVQLPLTRGACSELRHSIHINCDGALRICCVDRMWTLPVSVFDFDDISDFVASPSYATARTAIESPPYDPRCGPCPQRILSF